MRCGWKLWGKATSVNYFYISQVKNKLSYSIINKTVKMLLLTTVWCIDRKIIITDCINDLSMLQEVQCLLLIPVFSSADYRDPGGVHTHTHFKEGFHSHPVCCKIKTASSNYSEWKEQRFEWVVFLRKHWCNPDLRQGDIPSTTAPSRHQWRNSILLQQILQLATVIILSCQWPTVATCFHGDDMTLADCLEWTHTQKLMMASRLVLNN